MSDVSYGKEQEQRGLADDVPPDIIDVEPVDARNAESSADIGMALQIYQKVGMVPFEKTVIDELAKWQGVSSAPELEEMYDILPTGELYLGQMHYRRILNKAFGQGGWALVPMDPRPVVTGDQGKGTSQLVQVWALIAHGRYVSEAMGGAEYNPANSRMLWSDACETVKSNAVMRLCKDLGLAGDCWDRRYIAQWKKKHAIAVWVAKKYQDKFGKWKAKGDLQWRRADADPLRNELRPVEEGEASIEVAEVSFGVYAIVEGSATKGTGKTQHEKIQETGAAAAGAIKRAVQSPDKAVEKQKGGLPTSQTADPDRQPLLAIAQKAGHGGYFVGRGVTVVEVKRTAMKDKDGNPKKNGAGEISYSYGGKTDFGEWITFFSTTDANALNKAAKEKRTLDLQLKAMLKGEKWFINLEEIVGEA